MIVEDVTFTFMCSCVQVMDWIENHGEAFLSKHTGVGKSLHRARALQKRHDDFEDVAQVSPEARGLLVRGAPVTLWLEPRGSSGSSPAFHRIPELTWN